jgi:alginate O-acetyltransferase complex protein AlgI
VIQPVACESMFREGLYCLLFLFCVIVCAKSRRRNVRQRVLVVSSFALYLSWGHWFVVMLLTSTVLNFLVGKWLQRNPSARVLSIGILLNLALLGSFKYLPEIAIALPLSSLERFSHLALPLGISFWTFQAMSYLFDLYRGEELNPTFVEFTLYMAFFPVVISGPICRMPEMLPQFRSQQTTAWNNMTRGFSRIATGILMMQLARLLGQGILSGDGINTGFDRLAHWSGLDVWCLAIGYGLQLFFDFAGYSHIAIGAALAMSFTVPENFARPYQSTSVSMFWTRWHMSLSFWIRDYVFLPLAVLRREVWWRNLSLVIAMILFGLWHKATLLFLLWGCYHGVLLVIHRQLQQVQRKFNWTTESAIWTPISWTTTVALVSLGWVFFRANSLLQARQMLFAVVSPAIYSSRYLNGSLYGLVATLAAGYAIVLLTIDALDGSSKSVENGGCPGTPGIIAAIARYRRLWVPPVYALALLLVVIVTHTRGADAAQFMYRNF